MDYIAYYRVSTQKQGNSGLGLESQRQIVENFIATLKGSLRNEFVEIESGKVNQRPILKEAIVTSQNTGCTLLIAKLDRLSRSVSFISTLMESKIKFVACDIPEANEFTIHIFSALAEQERKLISSRTKLALQAKKVREPDWKPGTNNLTKEGREKAYNTNYMKARTDTCVVHAYHYIQTLLGKYSYAQIADKLNESNYITRTGKNFRASTVWNIVDKLGYNTK